MLASIAHPANAAPSSMLPRALRSSGWLSTVAKLGNSSPNASFENIHDNSFLFLVTAVSTAWAMASMPVQAVTLRGCERVSSGSRMAIFAAALGSPQAILLWVSISEISANDWHSLPVPAVVGITMSGSISRLAKPIPQ